MAPRAFERPATIALPPGVPGDEASGEDLVLEGLHVPSPEASDGGGAVIAPPHPLYGGSMESPVVTEIAHACERAGLASLRFNWRGVGASAGAVTGDADVGVKDYAASLDWIEDTVEGVITACGYSFGAATAVRSVAGRPRVRHLLLEGGGGVLASFFAAEQIDRVRVYVAPKIVGGAGAPTAVMGVGVERVADAWACADLELTRSGEDAALEGVLRRY